RPQLPCALGGPRSNSQRRSSNMKLPQRSALGFRSRSSTYTLISGVVMGMLAAGLAIPFVFGTSLTTVTTSAPTSVSGANTGSLASTASGQATADAGGTAASPTGAGAGSGDGTAQGTTGA